MDLHDMKHESQQGNKFMLVIVDRASKFIFAFPLPSKVSEQVASNLLTLCLTFGVPQEIRSDAGGEFTSDVMKHLCRWLTVPIGYGATGHPRGQGAVERAGGWLKEVLSELCKAWPDRWDHYVEVACWIKRTTPDTTLPTGVSPFEVLFGRQPRTQLDAISPQVDGGTSGMELVNFVEERKKRFKEVRELLERRNQSKEAECLKRNAQMKRKSIGEEAKIGMQLLVKEADNKLYGEGVGMSLVHDQWTGPWTVTGIPTPKISLEVTMQGRKIRRRVVSASCVKAFHVRPVDLRHKFEDEFAILAWRADLGLNGVSTAAAPLYTLFDRRAVMESNGVWVWEYRGRFQDGVESHWMSEEEVQDSFTGLQLDVFHALWESLQPGVRPRPPQEQNKEERDRKARQEALRAYPIGTRVRKKFVDGRGRSKEYGGEVVGFRNGYWRIHYEDGDREDMSRKDMMRWVVESRP